MKINFLKLNYAVLFLSLIFCGSGYSATIAFQKSESNSCGTIFINGELSIQDVASFQIAIAKMFSGGAKLGNCKYNLFRSVIVNSPGGDVDAAMNIANIIKDNEMTVAVRNGDLCYSSCVFVLAGGVKRLPFGRIGIHRPYFNNLDDKLTLAQIRVARDALKSKIKNFFDAMDINPILAEDMLQISPKDIKILSEKELDFYRLASADANQEEKENAKIAAFYDLSSSEYRKRDALADIKCKDFEVRFDKYSNPTGDAVEYQACRNTILLGISREVYEGRRKRLDDNCKILTADDQKLICYKKYLIGR